MSFPYNQTFTLLAGGITIQFWAKPGALRYNDQVMIARGPIPGSNQSFVQHMGRGGLSLEFDYDLFNITAVTMTGAPTSAESILTQLRAWHIAGTTIEVTTDHILEINAAAAMSMKIIELGVVEEAGIQHSYLLRFSLQQFNPGLAI